LGVGAVMLQKDPQLRKCETYENAVNQDTDVKLLSISFTIDAGLWNKSQTMSFEPWKPRNLNWVKTIQCEKNELFLGCISLKFYAKYDCWPCLGRHGCCV
jgi:hypothetical protein